MGRKMKKKVRIKDEGEGEDRISTLPDEVLHKIMFYLDDTKSAVQTSILSNRWRLIWKTLPFLTFERRTNFTPEGRNRFCKFVDHVFSHRNHDSGILTLDLLANAIPINGVVRCVKYAIFHNVQQLSVSRLDDFDLSIFKSCSLKKLKLRLNFEKFTIGETHSWDLPALTTLELFHTDDIYDWKFLESYLVCLPILTTLSLTSFVLPNSLSLPSLTSLRLQYCDLLQAVFDFPALVSLELDDVIYPINMKEFLSALVSLQSLTWALAFDDFDDCFISCPQLLNLKIRTVTSCRVYDPPRPSVNIVILSPKLRNFDSVGIFTITFGVSSLENVNIKLLGCFEDKSYISLKRLKRYYQRLTIMFPGLGGAKILSLDSETVETLSEVSDLLGHFPSPFYNLKYVQLPQGYKESSLSSITKSYLLGGSPGATIVTTLPQNDVLTHMVPVSLTARNVVFEEP